MRISLFQHTVATLLIAAGAAAEPVPRPGRELMGPRLSPALAAPAGIAAAGLEASSAGGTNFFAPEMSSYQLVLTGGLLLLAAKALRGRRAQR